MVLLQVSSSTITKIHTADAVFTVVLQYISTYCVGRFGDLFFIQLAFIVGSYWITLGEKE